MNCLTQQRLRELLDYNHETGVFTWRVSTSNRVKVGAVAGCYSHGYSQIMIDSGLHRAHRLAWLYVHGSFPEGQIDHINGDRADNRIANLRDVDRSTNQQNRRRANLGGTHGLIGVSRDKQTGKWRAQIMTNGQKRSLGRFTTPEAAHEAYLAAKRIHHYGCTI